MKGQYNIYPTLTNLSVRMLRKSEGKKIAEREALKILFERVPNMRQSINYSVLSDEHYWFKNPCVIFPESIDILSRLREAKIGLALESGIQFPHDCFSLAFPKGFKIAGIQANGCMISYMHRRDRFEMLHKPFYKNLDLGSPEYVDDKHKIGLYISYLNPFEDGMLTRCCVPTEWIPNALAAKDHIEYGHIIGNFDQDKVNGVMPLNNQDLEYQFELFQIITRIGIYSTACDTALRAGYPHVRPKHLEPKGLSYIDQTLGMASEVKTKAMHYRSWYFRQLTHKKYYQGQHAKKPIGSRIVFVKDTMIGQDIEAETLV